MEINLSTNLLDNGNWLIKDYYCFEKINHTITTSSVRPRSVTIAGSKWNEGELAKCISQVSKMKCRVRLTLQDAFEISAETANDWISTLMATKAK